MQTTKTYYDISDNPELVTTFKHIKDNEPVIFLVGGAGTGKSNFIKFLQNNLKNLTNKNCVVLAPTGIAAINVGGQTIHSFFNFRKGDIYNQKDLYKIKKNPVLDHTDLIIIDEISMVSSWMMDNIDYCLRLWFDKTKPFGGKQMLLIGDWFQLPPIVNKDDKDIAQFISQWESNYFFAGKVFLHPDLLVKAVELKKIYRQTDASFVNMLNRIRKCQVGFEKDIAYLNENCLIQKRIGTTNIPDECLLLTTKNDDADSHNTKKMLNLTLKGARERTFKGSVNGDFDFDHCLTPEPLTLCVGAKVLITKNISQLGLVNGDTGKVLGFNKDTISVFVQNKKATYEIPRVTWESLRYKWDDDTKTIKQYTEGTFTQFPLKLGYAVTIHKSQGLTLDALAIQANDAWDYGQVYVALSRAKSLDGLLLCKEIPLSAVQADPFIKKIYAMTFGTTDNTTSHHQPKTEPKAITFDNSSFTVDKKAEVDSVVIGGIQFQIFPSDNEKLQDLVRRTIPKLIEHNLIPPDEMQRLLTDKEYCYNTFDIYYDYSRNNIEKVTLLRTLDKGTKGDFGYNRYWAKPFGAYYITSCWYQGKKNKFAQWLIKLSKM